jgi:hypothetical protein
MRRLSGRVVVKETNSGIADLVVAAYDANLESAEAVLDAIESKGRDNFGRRITSVITDGQGAFCISGDDLQFSGNESRPNLLLVVFAPEDVQSAAKPFPLRPDKRILYISSVPRSDAGAEEAFVIRLLQEQLQRFSILQGDSPSKSNAGANLLQSATDQTVALRTSVQEKIGPYLRREQQRIDRIRRTATEKTQSLSGIPMHLRDGQLRNNKYLITHHTELAAKLKPLQDQAITDGVKRIKKVAATLRLSLTLPELRKLGVREQDGKLVGKISANNLVAKTRALMGGPDLVRQSTPSNALADQLERKYLLPQANLQPPIEKGAKKAPRKSKKER